VKRIVEDMEQAVCIFYAGNYDLIPGLARRRRKEQIENAYKTAASATAIEQLEVFINRFRYTATKAKQVQSRIKELEKNGADPDYQKEEKTVHFSFPQPESPAERIVGRVCQRPPRVTAIAGTNEHKVFGNVNFMIRARRTHPARGGSAGQRGREVGP